MNKSDVIPMRGKMSENYFAGGFLYHAPAKKILLHHRSDDAPMNPTLWAFFGGGSEPEDRGDPLVTWQREMAEELGITLDIDSVRPLHNYRTIRGTHRYVFFVDWPDITTDFALTEGVGYGWFAVEEAEALPLTHHSRLDLQYFRTEVEPSFSLPPSAAGEP